jgi:hypothetical protein
MASSKSDTARPAARKGQSSAKSTKTMAKKTAKPAPRASTARSRLEPIVQAVERPTTTKPAAGELPKLRGELPVPTSTFYF